jgi:hypothetical protein
MCTLTLISLAQSPSDQDALPRAHAFRLVANRDEQRSRPVALPPRRVRHDGLDAWWPIDPQGGGTWIAVNAAGIALGLLNANRPNKGAAAASLQSRGLIIPALLSARTLEEVCTRVCGLALASFAPFNLIATDGDFILEAGSARNDGAPTRTRWNGAPMLWTSSSLGDHVVAAPRRDLFDAMLVGARPTSQAQDEFHRTRWSSSPHLSPIMDRPDARTVSITTIEVSREPAIASCRYEPIPSGTESPLPPGALPHLPTHTLPLDAGEPVDA